MFKTTDSTGRIVLVTLEELIRIEEAQAVKALAVLIRYNGQVMTTAEYITRLVAEGRTPIVRQVDKIQPMSRRAFNRADNNEQRAHEQKIRDAGKGNEYQLHAADHFSVVGAYAFAYFNYLKG